MVGPLRSTKHFTPILKNTRSINSKDHLNETALIKAAGSGYKNIVQLSTEKGASIEAIKNPLHLAIQNGRTGLVELLLHQLKLRIRMAILFPYKKVILGCRATPREGCSH